MEEKKCPIQVANAGGAKTLFQNCLGEKCAWWYVELIGGERRERCVVVAIASILETISM